MYRSAQTKILKSTRLSKTTQTILKFSELSKREMSAQVASVTRMADQTSCQSTSFPMSTTAYPKKVAMQALPTKSNQTYLHISMALSFPQLFQSLWPHLLLLSFSSDCGKSSAPKSQRRRGEMVTNKTFISCPRQRQSLNWSSKIIRNHVKVLSIAHQEIMLP